MSSGFAKAKEKQIKNASALLGKKGFERPKNTCLWACFLNWY